MLDSTLCFKKLKHLYTNLASQFRQKRNIQREKTKKIVLRYLLHKHGFNHSRILYTY